MATIIKSARRATTEREPAWDIARIFPLQGTWDEDDYLSLDTNHLVEFTDGFIRVLPMPKPDHHRVVRFLVRKLEEAVGDERGEIFFAPVPLRLRGGKFREPDIMLIPVENASGVGPDYCQGASLVIEVVSPDANSQKRDWVEKRREYAAAGIREYWIVDPQRRTIVVLKLRGRKYVEHGTFGPGEQATSVLVQGFSVDVDALLAAGAGKCAKR